jgi:hypothetical protein
VRGVLTAVAVGACFSPRPPAGAQCASNGECPDGLVCVASTCEPPGTGGVDAAVDAAIDARSVDAPASAASFTVLGSRVEATIGAISATVDRAVPAGSLVVVLVGGRGRPPIMLSDAASNAWTMAMQVASPSGADGNAIGYATLAHELLANQAITATFAGSAGTDDRGVAIVLATGVSTLDQVGSAGTAQTTTPSATTPPPTGAPELVFGTMTAGTGADTITPGSAFTPVLAWAAGASSACFVARVDATPAGGETYAATASVPDDFAVAVAAFK